MREIVNAFEQLKKINEVYNIDNTAISEHIKNIDKAKVCTPVIGRFSSGKSALINTILGNNTRLLKEDITPETAIPTELVHDEGKGEKAIIYGKDGSTKELSIKEYRETEFSAEEVFKIRLMLANSFLASINRTMIVDMPGFESINNAHEMAIDRYVGESQAYIIVFPSDDMSMKSSLGSILRELCIYDMPIYIVITKCDKTDNDTREELENKLREDIAKYIGDKEVTFAHTSSLNGIVDDAKKILTEIDQKADDIIGKKYSMLFKNSANNTATYLSSVIKSSELSESQLAEDEENIKKELDEAEKRIKDINGKFDKDLDLCINAILGDINTALSNSESTLASIAASGGSINDRLNTIVREATAKGIKNRFEPIVNKYLKKIDDALNIDTGSVAANISFESVKANPAAAVVTGILAALVLGPVGGVIVGALLHLFISEKKKEEQRNKIIAQLNGSVFPQIMNQMSNQLGHTLHDKADEIKKAIDNNMQVKKATLLKALEDTRTKLTSEKQEKDEILGMAKQNLNIIEEIKNELL